MTEPNITLKEYVDTRFDCTQDAIHRATQVLDNRVETLNFWREQFITQNHLLLPRSEYNSAHTSLVDNINHVRESLSAYIAKSDLAAQNNQLAAAALDKRLETMNEFRAAMSDQAARLVQRVEFDAKSDSMEDRVMRIENKQSNWDGRMWAFGAAFTVCNVILSVLLTFWLGGGFHQLAGR